MIQTARIGGRSRLRKQGVQKERKKRPKNPRAKTNSKRRLGHCQGGQVEKKTKNEVVNSKHATNVITENF